jgi:hypothetical protein
MAASESSVVRSKRQPAREFPGGVAQVGQLATVHRLDQRFAVGKVPVHLRQVLSSPPEN